MNCSICGTKMIDSGTELIDETIYGAKYSQIFKCPNCGHRTTYEINEVDPQMPIKQLGIELQCGNCGAFLRILNRGKEETTVYQCPKCKDIIIKLRLKLGLII